MGSDQVFYDGRYRRKVTALRHEVPLEERGQFALFANELEKLCTRAETAASVAVSTTAGIFPLLKTAHENLLRAVYDTCGKETQTKIRELVEYVKSTGSVCFDLQSS